MVFRRRPEKPPLLSFQRILVPLAGNEADDAALRLATLLLTGTSGEASLLQVIEVPFDRQLDAEDSAAVSFSATGFSAEVEVDDIGLVVKYGDIWRRVAATV